MNTFELLKLIQNDPRFALSEKVGTYLYNSIPVTVPGSPAERELIDKNLQERGFAPLVEFMGTIEADVLYLTIKGTLPRTNIMPAAMAYCGNEPVYFFSVQNLNTLRCYQRCASWLYLLVNEDSRFMVDDDAWSIFFGSYPGMIPGSDAAKEFINIKLQSQAYPPLSEFTGKVEFGECYLVLKDALPKSDCPVDAICNKNGIMHYFYKLN